MESGEELKLLKKIITKHKPTSQIEVAELLEQNGVLVNQSTISRSLAKLNVVKVEGYYQLPAVSPIDSHLGTSIQATGAGDNLIVIKSAPGTANRLAFIIDNASINGVAGTIAGDDTIFVAVVQRKFQQKIINQINQVVGNEF